MDNQFKNRFRSQLSAYNIVINLCIYYLDNN